MPFFSPLARQPKNMATINAASLLMIIGSLRLFNCRINNAAIKQCCINIGEGLWIPCRQGSKNCGGKIIDSVIEQVDDASFGYLNEARKLSVYHHERWEGKGYLCGIKGEEIPLSARGMAVADVFDALVHKEGFPAEKALCIIRGETGTHFGPEIVEAFPECESEARAISEAAGFKSAKEY